MNMRSEGIPAGTRAAQLIAKIEGILAGIDREDGEAGGWWETSTGREFGERKLKEVADAIRKAYTPTDDERATIIAELRWLAEAREKYQTDTFPSIAREVQTSRHLADILERKAPVAEGGAGFGWIPSWLWDEWDQMRQHAPEPQGNPSDARVEAVAKALYESTWANGEYAKTSEFNKDSWRRHARAALRAAGGVR